mmetsp:Transcript_97417/g.253875  ORF Transcript_97417/g.253875 Transcript_97417/m.253875 type:complete len:269 (+) Transcript_97417:165-971(+)
MIKCKSHCSPMKQTINYYHSARCQRCQDRMAVDAVTCDSGGPHGHTILVLQALLLSLLAHQRMSLAQEHVKFVGGRPQLAKKCLGHGRVIRVELPHQAEPSQQQLPALGHGCHLIQKYLLPARVKRPIGATVLYQKVVVAHQGLVLLADHIALKSRGRHRERPHVCWHAHCSQSRGHLHPGDRGHVQAPRRRRRGSALEPGLERPRLPGRDGLQHVHGQALLLQQGLHQHEELDRLEVVGEPEPQVGRAPHVVGLGHAPDHLDLLLSL